jgi:lysophospholipase L1-like esterase
MFATRAHVESTPFAMRFLRRAALAMTLCACESSGPANTNAKRTPPPVASDWTGIVDVAADGAPAAGIDGVQGTWVLHVGDSFVEASFSQSLAPRFRDAGSRQVALTKTASYTTSWAYDPELDPWLARGPALVLVTLGANEVDNTFPQQHAGAIRRLSRRVSAIAPCVWIAPPMWKDAGSEWLQVIHDNCPPCLFFDSDAVLGGLGSEERQHDRIHPNALGGARWAEVFWRWLQEHRDVARGGWALEPFERR